MRIIFGWLKDTFIKKLRSSYKMEFVRTNYNLRLKPPISVSTAQGLSISWPMENFQLDFCCPDKYYGKDWLDCPFINSRQRPNIGPYLHSPIYQIPYTDIYTISYAYQ